jgi:transcriptional regulator with XRE-family HTH domain
VDGKKRKGGPRYRKTFRAKDRIAFRTLRVAMGFDQNSLSEEAGVYSGAVYKVEAGIPIERHIAQAIADTLKRPFDELFTQKENIEGALAVEELSHSHGGSDVEQASDLVSEGTFELVADGFIGNTAAELILDDDSTRSIRGCCSRLYEACLRDLAFGLVYGSHIVTAADFRPSSARPDPPGNELFQMIGEIGRRIKLDQYLVDGAVLSLKHSEILADIEYLGQCVLDPQMRPLFGEFMVQEARKHLGSDGSLFRAGLQAGEYKFDSKRDYYLEPLLQGALGVAATDVLVSFLPKDKDREPYALDALTQFATRNALTLVAIMWEYDLSAERRQMWRLPHILRSLVKQKSRERSLVQRQQELRELVVRNALLPALKRSERKSKHLLVGRLLDQRDDPVFRQVREVLAEENLMLLEPDPLKEKQAQRVLSNIRNLAAGSFENDEFVLKRRSALRKLDTAMAAEFEEELYRLFPELNVAVPLVGSLSKKYDGP